MPRFVAVMSTPTEYTSTRMKDSSPQPCTPSEEIAGLVERVTFFNEESGFAVLRVKVRGQRELVTVLGSLPSVSAGEWLTAKGWWVRDKEHGLQFKANALKAVPPTTSEGVERYLAGGFVKGVGPVLAKKLVGHFGAEVLGVIEKNPADLESVDGIGPKRRERIATAWQEGMHIREIMLFLHSLCLRPLRELCQRHLRQCRPSSAISRRHGNQSRRKLPAWSYARGSIRRNKC